jgi:hypothetical protein
MAPTQPGGIAASSITFFDPLGRSFDHYNHLGIALTTSGFLSIATPVHQSVGAPQRDGFNCGPWIIEWVADFLLHIPWNASRYNAIDINQRRRAHEFILQQLKIHHLQVGASPAADKS